jgi:hypothetical protein
MLSLTFMSSFSTPDLLKWIVNLCIRTCKTFWQEIKFSRNMNKIVVVLKGGLGNQLFCYAAARRLALANDAELVIDDVSGFQRDFAYRRKYALDRFHITARKATRRERLEPFGRYRRKLAETLSARRPLHERTYVAQEGIDFDPRLLHFRVQGTVYLDGYWQSEGYFRDVQDIIRDDLRIAPPHDPTNHAMGDKIRSVNAVCVHVRWFLKPGVRQAHTDYNLSWDYYSRAMKRIMGEFHDPHFFLFSDYPDCLDFARDFPEAPVTLVGTNRGDERAHADLWLMAQCKHFIIANSTFSWWGAWLGECNEKMVISPGIKAEGAGAWGFKGLIPDKWVTV